MFLEVTGRFRVLTSSGSGACHTAHGAQKTADSIANGTGDCSHAACDAGFVVVVNRHVDCLLNLGALVCVCK